VCILVRARHDKSLIIERELRDVELLNSDDYEVHRLDSFIDLNWFNTRVYSRRARDVLMGIRE
jgi:hypothetical protein